MLAACARVGATAGCPALRPAQQFENVKGTARPGSNLRMASSRHANMLWVPFRTAPLTVAGQPLYRTNIQLCGMTCHRIRIPCLQPLQALHGAVTPSQGRRVSRQSARLPVGPVWRTAAAPCTRQPQQPLAAFTLNLLLCAAHTHSHTPGATPDKQQL